MKRAITVFLAFILVFAVTACGIKSKVQGAVKSAITGETADKSDDYAIDEKKVENAVEKAVEEAVIENAFSEAAAAAYWKKVAGVNIDDVRPDWDWKIDESRMKTYGSSADQPNQGHASVCFEKAEGELTKEEYHSFALKLFNATAAASDSGYNITGWEFANDNRNALDETTFEEAMGLDTDSWLLMQGWGYIRDGKNMVVYINEDYDNSKDSAIGRDLYYYGATGDICIGLQKSFEDSMKDAEQYMTEHEDEIKEALEKYLS